jgi:hypothetical protein
LSVERRGCPTLPALVIALRRPDQELVNSAIDYHELPAAPVVGLDGQPLSGHSRGIKSAPECLLKLTPRAAARLGDFLRGLGYEHVQIDVCVEALAGVEAS